MSGWGWSCPHRRPWIGRWLRMSLQLQGVRWGPENRGDVFSANHTSLSPLLRQLNSEPVLDIIVAGDGGHMPDHTDALGGKLSEKQPTKRTQFSSPRNSSQQAGEKGLRPKATDGRNDGLLPHLPHSHVNARLRLHKSFCIEYRIFGRCCTQNCGIKTHEETLKFRLWWVTRAPFCQPPQRRTLPN